MWETEGYQGTIKRLRSKKEEKVCRSGENFESFAWPQPIGYLWWAHKKYGCLCMRWPGYLNLLWMSALCLLSLITCTLCKGSTSYKIRYLSNSFSMVCRGLPSPRLFPMELGYCYIYIYAFSRRFYPKRLTITFRLYIFISTCVPWESNPQPFAQQTQCSTTEPHRNTLLQWVDSHPPPPPHGLRVWNIENCIWMKCL